jgi:hypothetical protein
LGVDALCTFFDTVYGGHARHQGMAILLMITLYWIIYRQTSLTAFGNSARIKLQDIKHAISSNWTGSGGLAEQTKRKAFSLHLTAVFTVLTSIFIFQIALAVYRVHLDVTKPMSSNMAFAQYLAHHPEYDEAIIIGEPDYALTSLWYYTQRRIYLFREGRFGNIHKWEASSRTLGELLRIAQNLKTTAGKPVLLALGYKLSGCRPSLQVAYSFNKLLTASPEEIATFLSQTSKIAEFLQSTSDENYEVYLLR